MLRFVGENTVKQSKNIKVDIAEQHLTFDEKIWRTAKEYYKQIGYCDSTKVRLIPIGNAEGGGVSLLWMAGWRSKQGTPYAERVEQRAEYSAVWGYFP